VDDLKATDVSITPSPFYSRPFAHEAATLLSLPLHHIDLPCKPAARRAWVENIMTREWRTSTRVKARHRLLKASPDPALVPSRKHIYDSTISANCSRCNVPGTVEHVLMHCPNHASARSLLVVSLIGLGIQLTVNVILRCTARACQSFRQARRSVHTDVLRLTGVFIMSVDMTLHL